MEHIKNEIEDIIRELEYSAFNLCDKKIEDLPEGLFESTGADDTLLLSIVRLKQLSNRRKIQQFVKITYLQLTCCGKDK